MMNKKILIASIFATLMLLVPMTSAVDVISKNVTADNQPPNPPEIDGPSGFKVGVALVFTVSTTDPNGDNVSYFFDWDDGSVEGWIGPLGSGWEISIAHTFCAKRDHLIGVKAKDHPYEAESGWSYFLLRWRDSKVVVGSLVIDLFEYFPILHRLLYLIK